VLEDAFRAVGSDPVSALNMLIELLQRTSIYFQCKRCTLSGPKSQSPTGPRLLWPDCASRSEIR
jgi:hypothetical protein